MSSVTDDLEQRVSALESAIGLPSTGSASTASSAEAAQLRQRVAALEKQLARSNYRIQFLAKGYDAQRARAEAAESRLASK
jgi:hypothetical protein